MYATTLSLLSIAGGLAAAADTGASGTITGKDTGLSGTVSITNDRTLTISDFTLEAAVAPALFWRGSKTSDLSAGFRLSNQRVSKPASHETVTIQLDAGHTAADID
ncbi:hypothetical protein NLG97_g5498 [Lecanicillium saksenae]|uniref:Uncharacterized protein n=1 Tax=Lecanicillium saksenae TaxID=468837 RepID=A0ACC1QSA7_9HYPO|nr:hypothetical protein NLG97_g5498 [Lecanicillium saksenae]